MKIALDIGHANGTGARGNGLEEHEVATRITQALNQILKGSGHDVTVIDFPHLSNADDLNETIKAANMGDYDIGVSVHCDCSDNADAHGGHVCYLSEKGRRLANTIAEHINRLFPGRAEKTVKRANLAVLNKTNPVWVLVECGFISNVNDSSVMRDRPDKIAEHIAAGIQDYVHQ